MVNVKKVCALDVDAFLRPPPASQIVSGGTFEGSRQRTWGIASVWPQLVIRVHVFTLEPPGLVPPIFDRS